MVFFCRNNHSIINSLKSSSAEDAVQIISVEHPEHNIQISPDFNDSYLTMVPSISRTGSIGPRFGSVYLI